jgi:hypothetical protein
VAKRQGAHKKARSESRNQPVVRKVVEAPAAVEVTNTVETVETTTAAEETPTAE